MRKLKIKTKINVSVCAALMLAVLLFGNYTLSLSALVAAALHEFGHVLAAKLCGIPLEQIKLGIFGASLVTNNRLCSYKSEILLASAGPFANILCFILCSLFLPKTELFESFRISSLFLALLNLLPVKDLDGGRILYCLLASRFSPKSALRIIKYSSFLIVFSLWTLSVYLILRLGASLSLFVFSAFLFCKIFIKNDLADF